LLHRFAAGIHVPGPWRRGLCRWRVPCVHACILQGAALPWFRLGDPCLKWRAGYAQYGRLAKAHPHYLQDDVDRHARHCRNFSLRGFFSKDEILWQTWASEGGAYRILWFVGYGTALMTAFYMFRLMYLTFYSPSRMSHEVEHHVHESPKSMTVPLVILAICSIGAGWLSWPHSLGGSAHFEKFLEPVFAREAVIL